MIYKRSKRLAIYLSLFSCFLFIEYQYLGRTVPGSRLRFVTEELVEVEPEECIRTTQFDTGQSRSAGSDSDWSVQESPRLSASSRMRRVSARARWTSSSASPSRRRGLMRSTLSTTSSTSSLRRPFYAYAYALIKQCHLADWPWAARILSISIERPG